uniref:Uncharacterized protein n=1 Tax=viral metagenome TaxID=1070528 RepID=A0A6C0LAV1_9ZZZZ
MPPGKTPKLQILDTYSKLINEYFGLLNESEIMKEMNYPSSSVYIGVNAIHRVFEIILMKTKSIEKTYYYCQRAYYYYLEYIEQIYRANLSQNLNHMDIILFVYKKTIYDTYDGDDNDNSHTLTNIMTLNNETLVFDDKEWRIILLRIAKTINVIFHWENTTIEFHERKAISNNYLSRYLNKIDAIDSSLQYLEVIQEKMDMDYDVYVELLKEIIKKMESNRSKTGIDLNDFILTKFYLEEPQCREKFENGNMKEFVKWLYC